MPRIQINFPGSRDLYLTRVMDRVTEKEIDAFLSDMGVGMVRAFDSWRRVGVPSNENRLWEAFMEWASERVKWDGEALTKEKALLQVDAVRKILSRLVRSGVLVETVARGVEEWRLERGPKVGPGRPPREIE